MPWLEPGVVVVNVVERRVLYLLASALAELGSIEYQRTRWLTYIADEVHDPNDLFWMDLDIWIVHPEPIFADKTIASMVRAREHITFFSSHGTVSANQLISDPKWIEATADFAAAAIHILHDLNLYE